MTKNIEGLGKFIKNLRTENKFSQEELASILGITRPSLAKWETGDCDIKFSIICKLSIIFRFDIDEIRDKFFSYELKLIESLRNERSEKSGELKE